MLLFKGLRTLFKDNMDGSMWIFGIGVQSTGCPNGFLYNGMAILLPKELECLVIEMEFEGGECFPFA